MRPQPDDTPSVSQMPKNSKLSDLNRKYLDSSRNRLLLTAWGMEADTIKTNSANGEEVINLKIEIDQVENQPVDVPVVVVKALKDATGRLMIVSVDTQDRPKPGQCKSVLCRWREMMLQKLSKIHGMMGCHKQPHHKMPIHGGMMNGRPHHHHPQQGLDNVNAYKHHKNGRLLHKITAVLTHLVIPIMVGILAGMLTYLMGLILAMFVTFVWVKYRRGDPVYQPVAEDEETANRNSLDKGVWIEKEDVEAPPQYVEVEANEVQK